MKIINKKKQDEILKRITANAIMLHSLTTDLEILDKFIENTVEISYTIGGFEAAYKVRNSVLNYLNKEGEQHG